MKIILNSYIERCPSLSQDLVSCGPIGTSMRLRQPYWLRTCVDNGFLEASSADLQPTIDPDTSCRPFSSMGLTYGEFSYDLRKETYSGFTNQQTLPSDTTDAMHGLSSFFDVRGIVCALVCLWVFKTISLALQFYLCLRCIFLLRNTYQSRQEREAAH